MCGWLFASMSGLTRSATRAASALRDGALIDAIELARRLDVDRQQAQRDGAIDLRRALADAREHDLIGTEPAAHRDVHLAERVGVGVAAERLQQADDRERRIGLERVMDRVRIAVEGARRAWRRRRESRRRRRRSTACRPTRQCRSTATARACGAVEGVVEATASILSELGADPRFAATAAGTARPGWYDFESGTHRSRFTTTCLTLRRYPLMRLMR